MEEVWWFDFLCKKLKERGDLMSRPRDPSRECYYENPQGGVAIATDLIRDDQLFSIAGYPTVWQMLSHETRFSVESREKVFNQLAGKDSFPLLILYEWLSARVVFNKSELFSTRLWSTKSLRKLLITGYVEIFERVTQKLSLQEVNCAPYRSLVETGERNCYRWQQVPPYAGMLLVELMALDKCQAGRGAELVANCRQAIAQGKLLDCSVNVRDFPQPNFLPKKFGCAMAIDRYIKECRLSELLTLAMGVIMEKAAEDDLPNADEIAEKAFGVVKDETKGMRFANTLEECTFKFSDDVVPPFVNKLSQVAKGRNISVAWDTDIKLPGSPDNVFAEDELERDPCFTFDLNASGLSLEQIYQCKVVIRTHTTKAGEVKQDSVFGDVLFAEELEAAGQIDGYRVIVMPIFARFSLQYAWEKTKNRVVVIKFFPAGALLSRHGLICVDLEI